jgi:hypothetical protein
VPSTSIGVTDQLPTLSAVVRRDERRAVVYRHVVPFDSAVPESVGFETFDGDAGNDARIDWQRPEPSRRP